MRTATYAELGLEGPVDDARESARKPTFGNTVSRCRGCACRGRTMVRASGRAVSGRQARGGGPVRTRRDFEALAQRRPGTGADGPGRGGRLQDAGGRPGARPAP